MSLNDVDQGKLHMVKRGSTSKPVTNQASAGEGADQTIADTAMYSLASCAGLKSWLAAIVLSGLSLNATAQTPCNPPTPPQVTAIQLDQASIIGTLVPVTGSVTVSDPCNQGSHVFINADWNPTFGTAVDLPPGESHGSFTTPPGFFTYSVLGPLNHQVFASAGTGSASTSITVLPPQLTLSLGKTRVTGPAVVPLTVHANGLPGLFSFLISPGGVVAPSGSDTGTFVLLPVDTTTGGTINLDVSAVSRLTQVTISAFLIDQGRPRIVGPPQSPVTLTVLPSLPPPPPGPPTMIDPIAAGLLAGTKITTNPANLQTASQVVQGVSADGVTQVVIRIPASAAGKTFTVSLANTSLLDDGGLSDIADQTDFASSINVTAIDTPGGPTAFAVYLAPTTFLRQSDDPSSRTRIEPLQVQASDGSSTNIGISVYRPPLVLVHGLWSNTNSWAQFAPLIRNISDPAQNDPFYVNLASYATVLPNITGSTPAYDNITSKRVSANALGFDFNSQTVLAQIRQTILDFKRRNNIAAVQADVVAHSMGGDIVRTAASLPSFRSSDTYGAGPVDKLITIGTPHLGTQLAIQLLQDNNTCLRKLFATIGLYSFLTVQFSGGSTTFGAVGDLRGDGQGNQLSQALTAFHGVTPPFPIAYVSAAENDNNLKGLDCTICIAEVVRLKCSSDPLAVNLRRATWPNVFGGQPSDGIVPITSQLNGGTGFSFPGVIHSDGFKGLNFIGPAELDSQANGNLIPQRIIDLLNEPIYGPHFTSNTGQ